MAVLLLQAAFDGSIQFMLPPQRRHTHRSIVESILLSQFCLTEVIVIE